MNFNFLFKENIADLRLMLLERVWEQNPWSPAANGNEVVEGATAGNTTGNAAGTTTSTATTGATAGTLQPVNPFLFNGKAVDFTYNKDLSARLNRKLLKKKLKSVGGDKADATGMISEYWAQNGGASGSDKKWLDARASQYGYTTDANGNRDYHRKPGNWGKALATIGGALLGGPVGGAAAYMWADLKSLIPGLKKGFFDPTSVKSAAKTQPVTEQPVVEQPSVEQPVTNPQPVTGFDPSKGVTFSGFSGDWGKRALLVYDDNKNAEVWRTIAGDDNEITLDEFMAWQRANKVDGGVDGKLGRHSLVALGFGSLLGNYSWMNPHDQGGDDITTMRELVVTPESNVNKFNQHMSGLGYTPITLENGSIAFKDKTGKMFFNNGRMRVNGKMSNYDYQSLGKAGDIYYTADGGKRYSYKDGKLTPISEQDSSGWVNGGAIKEMKDFRNALNFNSETVNFGGKTFKNPYYLNNVFRTTNNAPDWNQSGLGLGALVRVNGVSGTLPVRVWNDRSFAIDTLNGKAYELDEDWFGEVDGRNETPVNTYDLYSFFDNFDSNKRQQYRYQKQGGVLRFQLGGQLDDQDKMLLASTLGMIGYAASQGKLMLIEEAAAQVASLALSQPESLQELASNKELVNAGVLAVGQETVQKLSQPGVMKLLLTQVSKMPKAMNGTKLNYIKELKGICPEGYEMQYFATGGNLCPRCMKSKKIEEAKCGKKMKKKHESGGVSKMMNSIKTSMKK